MSAPATRTPPKPKRRPLSPLVIFGLVVVLFIVLMALVSFFWTPFTPIYTDLKNRSVGPFTGGTGSVPTEPVVI